MKKHNSNIHKDFRKMFYEKEGLILLGKRNKNLWTLVAILFITFSAIGFASGSLQYLERKMDDPYVNWVNVNIPYTQNGDEGQVVKDRLNIDSVAKTNYNFKNVTAYFRYPLAFQSIEANGTIERIGRSIDVDDPILYEIFKKKNRVAGYPFRNENDIGIIVTEEFLSEFGYPEDAAFINMALALDKNNQEFVPLPIVAVLKELPGMTKFATTPYFRQLRKEPVRGNPFRRDATKELIFFAAGDSLNGVICYQALKKYFEQNTELSNLSPWVSSNKYIQSYKEGTEISISFLEELSLNRLDEIYSKMLVSPRLSKIKDDLIRIYSFRTYPIYEYSNYDFLAINFIDLSEVRAFKKYFYENHKLRIDIAQIEAKENYSYVSKLTLIISSILIVFSVIVIAMFISNLLKSHLDKIKSNIGTFKAFGLSNKDILDIYLKLSMWFVLIAMFIAFIFSMLFGLSGGVRIGLAIMNASIEPNENYFHLFNYWLLTSVILVLIVSVLVINKTAKEILKKTTGDLIYNR